MAKQVTGSNSNDRDSATVLAAQAASIIQGVFVGLDSDGKMKLGDYRVAQGPVEARGTPVNNAQLLDPKNNVLDTFTTLGYTWAGKVEGLTGLTKGATYYLHSGGGITATKPAAATGDIDQPVGFAISATVLRIKIGDAVIHA